MHTMCLPGTYGGQKKVADHLDLGLQVMHSCEP